jgi:uncharacterized protein (DUF305 family)
MLRNLDEISDCASKAMIAHNTPSSTFGRQILRPRSSHRRIVRPMSTVRIAAAATLLSALILSSCAAPVATPTSDSATHSSHSSHAPADPNAPFDAQFIDAMIVHHEGAVTMAEEARAQATKEEIRTLADAILASQRAEIEQMKAWRKAWYPDLPATSGMQMDMGPMSVAAGDALYDVRFIDAMIPHHEGAVAMAQEALAKSERAEIKALAQAIIDAQTEEIARMKEWRAAWAPAQ